VSLKRTAEDRKGWRYSGIMSKACVQQKTKEIYYSYCYCQLPANYIAMSFLFGVVRVCC